MRCFLVVTAFLALAACAPADPATGPSTTWRCDNGVTFSTRMTKGGNAEVLAGGKAYHVPGVEAGSGVRYTDGKIEFWEHGGEALLEGPDGGPYDNCKS